MLGGGGPRNRQVDSCPGTVPPLIGHASLGSKGLQHFVLHLPGASPGLGEPCRAEWDQFPPGLLPPFPGTQPRPAPSVPGRSAPPGRRRKQPAPGPFLLHSAATPTLSPPVASLCRRVLLRGRRVSLSLPPSPGDPASRTLGSRSVPWVLRPAGAPGGGGGVPRAGTSARVGRRGSALFPGGAAPDPGGGAVVRGGPSRPGRRLRPGLLLLLFLRPPWLGKWEVAAACVCARVRGAAERSLRCRRRVRDTERRAPRCRIRIGRRRLCCGAANKEEEPSREVGNKDPRDQSLAEKKAVVGLPLLLPSVLVRLSVPFPGVPVGSEPAASLPSSGRKLPGLRALVSRRSPAPSAHPWLCLSGTPASSLRGYSCFPVALCGADFPNLRLRIYF